MKILNYKVKGEMIKITTDNPGRPDFVYFKDKFNNGAELVAEIEKSIGFETSRKKIKKDKSDKLLTDLEKLK